MPSGCISTIEFELCFLWCCEKFASIVILAFRGAYAESEPQELISAASFCVLLVQQIKQKVFVPLNKSLRIHLSVFKLFISVALYPLQKSSQGHLLLGSESFFLLLQ